MPQNTETARVHGPGHEKRDVNYRAVFIFGITLTLTLLAVSFGMRAVFGHFARTQPLGPPTTPFDMGRVLPPEPRLQTQPKRDLQLTREEQQQLLNSYGWADQTTEKVRIPIDRAMDLVLQRGLPIRQQPPEGARPGSAAQSANHLGASTAEQRKQRR
jgi:hypothetical protein